MGVGFKLSFLYGERKLVLDEKILSVNEDVLYSACTLLKNTKYFQSKR